MSVMLRGIEAVIVGALGALPWLQSSPGVPDGARCRSVRDYKTAIDFGAIKSPAAILQYRGASLAGTPNRTGVIGLPIKEDFWLRWDLYLLATDFSPWVEGNLAIDSSLAPGSYQQVDDVFGVLQGLSVMPAGEQVGRLMYQGDSYLTAVAGHVIYASRWAHRARRTGEITA